MSMYKTDMVALKHSLSRILSLCRRDSLYVILAFKPNFFNPEFYDVTVRNIYGRDFEGMYRIDAFIKKFFYKCFKLTTPRKYAVFEYDKDEHFRFDEEWTSKVVIEEPKSVREHKHMELLGVTTIAGIPGYSGTYVYTEPLDEYETL